MTDLLIISSACLALGGFLGYLWGSRPERHRRREQEAQERIEQELRATYMPRHRATPENAGEPAVIRSARLVSSKAWGKQQQ